jgi:hypothetical protein
MIAIELRGERLFRPEQFLERATQCIDIGNDGHDAVNLLFRRHIPRSSENTRKGRLVTIASIRFRPI